MKVLLTGASGFIGGALAKYLNDIGFEVHLLLRSDKDLNPLIKECSDIEKHIVEINYENIYKVCEGVMPRMILHLASLFLPQHEPKNIDSLIDSNVRFGAYLLESMSQLNIRYFLNTGTSWEHFKNSSYEPVNLYASTKYAFQKIIDYYVSIKKINAITLKLFDTYGPDDKRQKLVHLLRKIAIDGGQLEMSPGEQEINLVHIDDVCRAYVRAVSLLIEQDIGHKEYGVASKKPMKLKEFVIFFEKVIGKKIKVHWGGKKYREREVMDVWSTFVRLPEWEEKIELKDGLRQLFDEGA